MQGWTELLVAEAFRNCKSLHAHVMFTSAPPPPTPVPLSFAQREARALCLELLMRSKGDEEVMKGFVEKRGLTFIKGWLAEETTSVGMIKLLLSLAKVTQHSCARTAFVRVCCVGAAEASSVLCHAP